MSASTEAAWHALHDPLWHFIRKQVHSEENAEDLLQDVFLKIHLNIGHLREDEKLESWVYQITRNLIIDHYRKHRPVASLDDSEIALLVEELPEEDIRAELAPAILAMVNCLPSPYREALFLVDYQGISQKELATRFGLSFSGAKSRVQRAREKFKQCLLDCCHFEFDRLGRVIDYQPRRECCVGRSC